MNHTITLYTGVDVEQAVYQAAFSQTDGMADIISQIRAQATAEVADVDGTTSKGRDKLKSVAYSVAKAKTAIDGTGKELVAEAKAKIKIVDDNRKTVRDELDALRDEIRRPVTEWEEAQKAEQAKIDSLLAELDGLTAIQDVNGEWVNSDSLKNCLSQAQQLANHENERVQNRAADVIQHLQQAIVAAEQREAQQAEIAQLKAEQAAQAKAAYEAKIAAQAAEQAKAQAEQAMKAEREAAERAKIEAQLQAEREAAEREAAERAKIEAQLQAEQAEREKQAALAELEKQNAKRIAAEQRAADVEHKRAVNRGILSTMLECGIDEAAAKAFLLKVVNGKVAHLSVNY